MLRDEYCQSAVHSVFLLCMCVVPLLPTSSPTGVHFIWVGINKYHPFGATALSRLSCLFSCSRLSCFFTTGAFETLWIPLSCVQWKRRSRRNNWCWGRKKSCFCSSRSDWSRVLSSTPDIFLHVSAICFPSSFWSSRICCITCKIALSSCGASEVREREITYVDKGACSFRRLRWLSVLFISTSHRNTSNRITSRPAAQLRLEWLGRALASPSMRLGALRVMTFSIKITSPKSTAGPLGPSVVSELQKA